MENWRLFVCGTNQDTEINRMTVQSKDCTLVGKCDKRHICAKMVGGLVSVLKDSCSIESDSDDNEFWPDIGKNKVVLSQLYWQNSRCQFY